MTSQAHLVKVLVQTVWVVIDDETGVATEMSDQGVVVPAAEWPEFYERHCADFENIKALAREQSTEAKTNGSGRRTRKRS